MSITTIVCVNCKKVLREGDKNNLEEKLCPDCVIKAESNEKPSNIIRLNEVPEVARSRFAIENELRTLKKRISKLNIEMPFKKINDEFCLMIVITDRFNKPFAEFGFNVKTLERIIEDLKQLQEHDDGPADDISPMGDSTSEEPH